MNTKQDKTKHSPNRHEAHRGEIAEQADHVYHEAKKLGTQIYDEGRHRFDELQENVKGHTDKIVQKVHSSPLSSLLMAAGIGFILARLLRR
ncbi:hypothetical protein [Legionella micdadei]|uniref:DUF883 domain-containing protein n=1 Tax=Legionella micdadei TaxID=451 RepID=A0A098GIK6_LEGMI|nr:hypothetical protein [Legionella micdadei]ARG96784.1 hypothetical protein B6N58_03385 [Legionella micdadei]ARG99517.1 hypothetical protein B6V88_03295 [Legionella micdadei]KTD26455.1 hypothetical protein Lmic_2549 [Legionella micdadei]NSL17954.1 hypothetical protein [Legionella micdadei]CEG61827.1 conserved protein of unknown function [Legionella micdadei]